MLDLTPDRQDRQDLTPDRQTPDRHISKNATDFGIRLMPWLGVRSHSSRNFSWWKAHPCNDNKQAESCIGHNKNPFRSVIVKKTFKPVLNKTSIILHFTSLTSKPHFKSCKWAQYTYPRLSYNYYNSDKVNYPKPPITYP